jgi:hypothetical protein
LYQEKTKTQKTPKLNKPKYIKRPHNIDKYCGFYKTDINGKINKNITHINLDECGKYFKGVGSTFSFFVYTKEEYKNKTNFVVKNIDKSITSFESDLNDTIFDVFPRDLSTLAISILNKTIKNTMF